VFPNIQDQFLHAMESDTMDPRAMEGDVHLPEDETTGILYLARRSKYHISIFPLSKGELIPMLD